jgi:DNA-binding transcriptional ArsR family regulator
MEITDPKVMRALAHPARLAILEYFAAGRTGTATEFAKLCDLSPSAMSYHLRALAKVGLAEEAPSRGDGRERVWQSAVRGINLDWANADGETHQAAAELTGLFLERENARAREWLRREPTEPTEWRSVAFLRDTYLVVTPSELVTIAEGLEEVIKPYLRYERTDPPAEARLVNYVVRMYPLPAESSG